jgi:hypothetical protein
MNHFIRTQIIELKIQNEEGAFAIQQRIRDLFYQVILPVLEKAFDEISIPEEVIHLDRFEIDLGIVSIKDIEALDLTETFREKIKGQITAILLSPHKTKKSKRTFRMSLTEQWMYYMQHGFLPWNTIKTNTQWYQQVLEGFACDSASIELLRKLISTDERAVKRIVLLHAQEFLIHLTEALTSEKQIDLDKAITIIKKVLGEAGKQNESIRFARAVWEKGLHYASKENRHTSNEIIQHIIPWQLDEPEIELLRKNKEHAPDLIELILKTKNSGEKSREQDPQVKEIQPPVNKVSKVESKPPDDGLFVPHAGLVLLHPFLFNLFNFLGLLEGKDFKSSYHHQKAFVVLHFLSTGSLTFEEHELVVAKLLCNYSLEELVDPEIKLSSEEQDECEALLKEMIARWSILKNTSPDTLRTNFLQRGGKLYTMGNEPHLLIESNVLDVLLDHLPWAIGIIKLPWMKQLLKVEWR